MNNINKMFIPLIGWYFIIKYSNKDVFIPDIYELFAIAFQLTVLVITSFTIAVLIK